MGYCPDCGWDGYTEGVHKPCSEQLRAEDIYPDIPLDDLDDYAREEQDLAEMAEFRA